MKGSDGDIAVIPVDESYIKYGLTSPITKQHLDLFDKGITVDVELKEVEGKRVVTKIFKYQI